MSDIHRLETAGITVNIRIEGNGPTLLFLGGSNFDLSLRAPVFDSALKDHFTLAAASPRGLGGSDAPNGNWCMTDYANDAANILNALGWEQTYLLGESFGAMTALHLAALHPTRLRGLAMAVGAAGGEGGSSYPIHEFLALSSPAERAESSLKIQDIRFVDTLKKFPHRAKKTIDDRIASDAKFQASHDNAKNYPRLLHARASHNAWCLLPGINIPTLIFAGRYDLQAPMGRAEKMVEAMPDAQLTIVDGGHNLCFETPLPVNALIEHWGRCQESIA